MILHGPVDTLATTIRYTTLDTVKDALRIPLANTDKDDRITAAIIAGEIGIDQALGRSFPDIGVHDWSAQYMLDPATAAPPGDGNLRHDGDTDLYLSREPLFLGDAAADEPDDVTTTRYVYVSQNGARFVTLAADTITEANDYWHIETTVEDGSWTSPAFLDYGLVSVVFLRALAAAGVPVPVANAAANVAVGVYKLRDSPTGTAGSDDFVGALDVTEVVRRAISRDPLLAGFKVRGSFGVA